MRTTKILVIAVGLLITLSRCSEDDDIVKPAEPEKPITIGIPVGDTKTDDLTIDGNITNETDDSYTAEGTLYVGSGEGKAEVASGTFTVTTDDEGNLLSIEGNGVAQVPDLGMFKSFTTESIVESEFIYNTGKYFKDLNNDFKSLPLRDTSYYFYFNLLNLAPGASMEWQIKNAGLGVTSFFVNLPSEEIIIPSGSFSFDLPSGSVKVGDALAIGISSKGSFSFSPTVYEDSALNVILNEKKAFSDLQGMLYLSGEMSITKSMPYAIAGTVVVDAGFDDLFEHGFAGAESDIALNGTLLFSNDLLSLLPADLEAELTNVTMRFRGNGGVAGGSASGGSVAFAGEFDDDAFMDPILEAIAGKTVAEHFPRSGNDGAMFMSFSDNRDDFSMYVRADFGISLPGIGERKLRQGMFYITPDEIRVSGGLGLPFVPGNVYATGTVGFDGKIHLTGSATGDLELGHDLRFNSELTVDIYNDSVTLKGNIDVPHEIGKVAIRGKIGSEGLAFSGKVSTRFKAGPIDLPLTNLEINGTHQGVTVKGELRINPQYSLAQVTGKITTTELLLSGRLNAPEMIFGSGSESVKFPSVNMDFTASSKSGVRFQGMLNIPYGIARAEVTGQMTNEKDAYGYPDIFLVARFASNPTIQYGGLYFPSTSFSMTLSAATGVQFEGKLGIHGGFGVAQVRGKIRGNELTFDGYFGNKVNLGGISMGADMEVSFSSAGNVRVYGFGKDTYPLAVWGSVTTPIGIVLNATGVVDWNGLPMTYGNLLVDNAIGPITLGGTLQFEFGGTIGIYFHGKLCANVPIIGGCETKTFTINADWDGVVNSKLCFLSVACVSIMDIYNAVK